LQILNAESKTANRWPENAMANEKRTKGQTMIYKAMHRKLKIEQ